MLSQRWLIYRGWVWSISALPLTIVKGTWMVFQDNSYEILCFKFQEKYKKSLLQEVFQHLMIWNIFGDSKKQFHNLDQLFGNKRYLSAIFTTASLNLMKKIFVLQLLQMTLESFWDKYLWTDKQSLLQYKRDNLTDIHEN